MNIDDFGIVDSLVVAGMGILIVFSVLLIIIGYLYLQSKVFLALDKKKQKQIQQPNTPVVAPAQEVVQQNDEEVVAVISACIYAMLQEDDTVDSDAEFVIRKIEKLKWSK